MANTKKTTTAESEKDIKTEVSEDVSKANDDIKSEAETAKNNTAGVLKTINKTVDEVAGVSDKKSSSRKLDIALDEEIAVRSVTYGGLGWINSKNNAHYRWSNIGDIEYIPFGELVTMNNTKQNFLTEPYVILMDERAVEYFRLTGVYEKLAVVNSLADLFAEGDLVKIENALRDIRSTNMRNVAISKIKELRASHVLTNIDVIHLVERILCFDLE